MLGAVLRLETAATNFKCLLWIVLIALRAGGFGNGYWALDTDMPIVTIFDAVVKRLT